MVHFFDTEIAQQYGVNAAILLQNIAYWCELNEANDINYFDGTYWTFNSRKALTIIFPYMSERQIGTAIQKLIDEGLVIIGNYNKMPYDRTLWYALSKKGKSIMQKCKMEDAEMSNDKMQKCQTNTRYIPNNNPYNNTDSIADKPKRSAFTPPTFDEVNAYCLERKNGIDAQSFIDFYESKGWMIGKDKMKNWKAAIRTWENRRKSEQTKKTDIPSDDDYDFSNFLRG